MFVPRISTKGTICVPAKMLSGWCDMAQQRVIKDNSGKPDAKRWEERIENHGMNRKYRTNGAEDEAYSAKRQCLVERGRRGKIGDRGGTGPYRMR